jgi:DNA-directed RNA polymerase specialized sigma24 family protein
MPTAIESSVRSRTPKDAVQESLLGAWRGLAGFERPESLRTWLFGWPPRLPADILAARQHATELVFDAL